MAQKKGPFLIVWIRDGEFDGIRQLDTLAEAEQIVDGWAADPDNAGLSASATVVDMTNRKRTRVLFVHVPYM
ncbi:MAG: hypothetical protein A3E01_07950 [Gammaproteobacteria bacterium RIFCSPHIGHO2_12_FULL_63_22]|nr:MAG: hypothetical protein A3E01_07950 [Gammaproteobacteria bacterium RIFCSPHIGHO2_12_FULL_63_22]